jgi:hypothetical protein
VVLSRPAPLRFSALKPLMLLVPSSFLQNGMKRLMSSLLVLVLQALLQLLKPRRLVLP